MNENYLQSFLSEKGLSKYRFSKETGLTMPSVYRWLQGYKISKACAFRIKAVYPDFDLSKVRPDCVGL